MVEIFETKNGNVKAKLRELGPYEYVDYKLEQEFGKRKEKDVKNFEDGARYKGEWLDGTHIKEGKGMVIYADGSVYEGYWKNDYRHGPGRYIHTDSYVYEGERRIDKKHGRGKEVHANGNMYVGMYFDGERNG